MASSQTHFFCISLLFLMVSFFQPSLHQPFCHKVERLALVQFRKSFVIERHASASPAAYPKVDLWESHGVDCCSWEGVWCDRHTGHIIGLDLSNSCLFGSINSSSSLFRLVHLRHLNLAFNDFNYSEIPSAFGNLSKLTYLNLSNSFFYGQVPLEISKLSKLAKLDLSSNVDISYRGLLELRKPNLNNLVHNLTMLVSLDLSFVNINSPIPSALANLSSLSSMGLSRCGLFGTFPIVIFQLSKLEYLRVDGNWGLSGSLPEFHFSNPLKALFVNNTSISGEFPASFGLLSSLEYLEARNCNFSGFLPSSLSNLTMLYHFSLRNNSFQGSMVPFLSNLTQLVYLDLGFNQFTFSEIPSLSSSTHLQVLIVCSNQISGPFPSWLVNLTHLTELHLEENMLEGYLPSSISRLKNLEILGISHNYFVGTVLFNTLLGLKHLNYLSLSSNSFSLLTENITNSSIPKFHALGLGSCGLTEIPNFLHNQDQLGALGLSSNNIHGLIPRWLLKTSASLWYIDLGNNSFTGFEESYDVVIPSSMVLLSLMSNSLRGPLPIPPHSIFYYDVGGNKFSGEIPPQFCSLSSLNLLDLSRNNLSGTIPQCLASQSKSLLILNLEGNNFHGLIPATWVAGNELREIKLGRNNLHGKLPRSLVNCERLEYLDVGNNRIRDSFPSWLGALPELKIVILRFNEFYGGIDDPESDFLLPKLRIIDFSHNEFVGHLPIKFFKRWKAMENLGVENATFLHVDFNVSVGKDLSGPFAIPYSMTIANKGEKMEYAKILDIFTAIDLSCNKLEGEIPEAVGNLRRLQLLNLSNNMLVGSIPPALGHLSNLEALDFSRNKLTGRIPAELTQLNFLEVFDVSRNLLAGPIPQGKQFNTFDNSSFDGNVELCGTPLLKKCGSSRTKALPPSSSTSEENNDSSLLPGFGWKAVLLGFGCGFLGGAVIGANVFTRKQEWFMKTFGVKQDRVWRKAGRLNGRVQRK